MCLKTSPKQKHNPASGMEIRPLIMCLLITKKDTQKPIRESRAQFLPSSVLWVWWGDKPLYSCWDLYLHFLGLSKKQLLGQITKDQRQKSQPGTPAGGGRRRGQHGLILFNLVNNTRSSQAKYRLSLQYLTFYSLWPKIQPPFRFFPVKHAGIVFIVFGWLKQRLELEQRRPTTKTLRIVVERCCSNLTKRFSKASPVLSVKTKTSISVRNSCRFES